MSVTIFDQNEITVPAALPQLVRISGFIGKYLDEIQCPEKARIYFRIAVDEVFSNIVRHSDAKKGDTVTVLVRTEEDPLSVVIMFRDEGPRFDPLAAAEPDVTASARKRRVGGLGLFMLKRIMDEVTYEYRDEQNILTIRKKINK